MSTNKSCPYRNLLSLQSAKNAKAQVDLVAINVEGMSGKHYGRKDWRLARFGWRKQKYLADCQANKKAASKGM
jgi:hypothetical protein